MIRRTLLVLALACSPAAHAWAQGITPGHGEDCFAPAAPLVALSGGADGTFEEQIDRLKSPAIRLSRYDRDGWSIPRLWTGATLCWDRDLNAVRLGFAGDGPVDAAELGRILTTPGLLPDFASAGLVIADVTVEGTLHLEKGAFDFPLDFIRVRFTRPDRTSVRGEEAPVALMVRDSGFEQPVRITGSVFYGRVFIENTAFGQGLAIEDSDFYIAGRELGPSSSSRTTERSLQLLNTTVDGKLRLDASLFEARIFIDHGSIGYMEATDNTIGGLFGLRNNVIEKVDLKDNLFSLGVVISNNRVETLLNLQGGVIGLAGTGRDPEIAVNTIGGAFYFAPDHLLAEVDRLDLTYDDVRGPAEIHLPATWGAHREPRRRKTVDLTSSAVASRLTLCAPNGDGICEPPPADAAALRAYCPERSADAPLTVVRLTNASLGSLAWEFPPDCRYRWYGVGLQYRFLGDPDAERIGASPAGARFKPAVAAMYPPMMGTGGELENWRYLMMEPSADALLYLAGHLRSRGEFTESRTVLMEAKALDYAPPAGCFRPEPLAYLSLVSYRFWDRDCLTTGAAYVFLLPTGFGVKPERALIMLLIGWAGG